MLVDVFVYGVYLGKKLKGGMFFGWNELFEKLEKKIFVGIGIWMGLMNCCRGVCCCLLEVESHIVVLLLGQSTLCCCSEFKN